MMIPDLNAARARHLGLTIPAHVADQREELLAFVEAAEGQARQAAGIELASCVLSSPTVRIHACANGVCRDVFVHKIVLDKIPFFHKPCDAEVELTLPDGVEHEALLQLLWSLYAPHPCVSSTILGCEMLSLAKFLMLPELFPKLLVALKCSLTSFESLDEACQWFEGKGMFEGDVKTMLTSVETSMINNFLKSRTAEKCPTTCSHEFSTLLAAIQRRVASGSVKAAATLLFKLLDGGSAAQGRWTQSKVYRVGDKAENSQKVGAHVEMRYFTHKTKKFEYRTISCYVKDNFTLMIALAKTLITLNPESLNLLLYGFVSGLPLTVKAESIANGFSSQPSRVGVSCIPRGWDRWDASYTELVALMVELIRLGRIDAADVSLSMLILTLHWSEDDKAWFGLSEGFIINAVARVCGELDNEGTALLARSLTSEALPAEVQSRWERLLEGAGLSEIRNLRRSLLSRTHLILLQCNMKVKLVNVLEAGRAAGASKEIGGGGCEAVSDSCEKMADVEKTPEKKKCQGLTSAFEKHQNSEGCETTAKKARTSQEASDTPTKFEEDSERNEEKAVSPSTVLAEARRQGLKPKLTRLMSHPEIAKKGFDLGFLFATLKQAGGTVPAAKRKLLGI